MEMLETSEALVAAAVAVVRPFVRRLLLRGVTFGQLERRLRELFVEVAIEITAGEGKQTDSRLAALTGLNRKEIRRIRGNSGGGPPATFTRSLAASLISQWMEDPKIVGRTGRPLAIPYDSANGPCFTRLAARTTNDMGPRALLQVLLDAGVAELRKGDMVALKRSAYVPERGRPEAVAMLVEDPAELVDTMLYNVLGEGEEPLLQQKLAYDNLGASGMQWLRRRLRGDAERFLKSANKTLAKHDRDRNPKAPGGARTYAGIGVYYFETPLESGSE